MGFTQDTRVKDSERDLGSRTGMLIPMAKAIRPLSWNRNSVDSLLYSARRC